MGWCEGIRISRKSGMLGKLVFSRLISIHCRRFEFRNISLHCCVDLALALSGKFDVRIDFLCVSRLLRFLILIYMMTIMLEDKNYLKTKSRKILKNVSEERN